MGGRLRDFVALVAGDGVADLARGGVGPRRSHSPATDVQDVDLHL